MQPAATVIIANNVDVDADVTDARMFYMTTGSTLTLTNSNIRGTSFSGTSRIFYISQAGATLNCDGNVYGDGFAHVYYLPKIGSFTSDNNCFDDNTENFKINAPSYATVAAYQAGESQDLNSTIGGCAA